MLHILEVVTAVVLVMVVGLHVLDVVAVEVLVRVVVLHALDAVTVVVLVMVGAGVGELVGAGVGEQSVSWTVRELARSLLMGDSKKAGHRPVTLVGYSFGALVIYACLWN